jgi:hypothetical protein
VQWSQEAVFAGTTCLLLAFPIFILLRGHRRSRNPRMLLAALAVCAFFATDFFLLLAHVGWVPGSDQTELVEFVGDIVTAILLVLAFSLRFGGRA